MRSEGTGDVVLTKAGLGNKVYMPVRDYPDAEIVGLVVTASVMTGVSVAHLLEDFGVFVGPTLMKTYGHLLQPQWKTIDLKFTHVALLSDDPTAMPGRSTPVCGSLTYSYHCAFQLRAPVSSTQPD